MWAAWEQERKLQNIDDYCKKLVLEEKQNMKVSEKNNNDGEPKSILSVLLKVSVVFSLQKDSDTLNKHPIIYILCIIGF